VVTTPNKNSSRPPPALQVGSTILNSIKVGSLPSLQAKSLEKLASYQLLLKRNHREDPMDGQAINWWSDMPQVLCKLCRGIECPLGSWKGASANGTESAFPVFPSFLIIWPFFMVLPTFSMDSFIEWFSVC
jgi:hypothetical protein